MKKSNLIVGILYVLVGIACLAAALLTETKLESILCGFAGGVIAPGCMMIYKYFHLASPENRKKYEEKLENQRIELCDELNVKVRNQTARYIYTIGFCALLIFATVFCVLDALELVENGTLFACFLLGYLGLQALMGWLISRRIMKKYQSV